MPPRTAWLQSNRECGNETENLPPRNGPLLGYA
jgi:hypothetical protein